MRIRQSILKFLACFALLFILRGKAFAQPYPVTATIQLTAPSIPYYDGFTIVTDNKLLSTIILNDVTKPFYNVRLKVTISGEGITLTSSFNSKPLPLTLYYNVPVVLTGADLSQYFNPDNLDFYGISKEEFLKQGKLKEGIYSICIEALDYQRYTDPPVSNRACTNGLLIEHDPPLILSLIGKQKYLQPQSYQFTWQPQHVGAFPVEYELEIFELSNGITADQALQYKIQPVITKTVTRTTYWYQPSDPLLKTDTEYLVRVRAKDVTNQNQFKNDGYSQHEIFVITTDCEIGSACDDGNPCTINDIFTGKCTCVGEYLPDTDGDGVCDVLDICANGADDVDVDGDCIPDACDDCVVGTPCDDGIPCTKDDHIVMNAEGECICIGKIVKDSDDDTFCDAIDLCPGGDDNIDADGDKLPDACDDCIVGKKCDDGDPHTFNDMMIRDPQYPEGTIVPSWVEPCICQGTPCASDSQNDTDGDGICNESDPCPGATNNDSGDSDGDGVPNCLECEVQSNISVANYTCDYYCYKFVETLTHVRITSFTIKTPSGYQSVDGNTEGFHFPYNCNTVDCGTVVQSFIDDFNLWLASNNYMGTAQFEDYTDQNGVNSRPFCVKGTNIEFLEIKVSSQPLASSGIYTAGATPTFTQQNCTQVSPTNTITLQVLSAYPESVLTYLWSNGATTPSIELTFPLDPNTSYSVTVTHTSLGCMDIASLPNNSLCTPGTPCNDNNFCTIDDELDLHCNCVGQYIDTDHDGICDSQDTSPPPTCVVGTPCDDGNKCTYPDMYDADCNCVGECQDDDEDGVCNEEDKCADFPDQIDTDKDGIPDGCDTELCGALYPKGTPMAVKMIDLMKTYCACNGEKKPLIRESRFLLDFQLYLTITYKDESPEGSCGKTYTPIPKKFWDNDTDFDGIWDYLDIAPCDNSIPFDDNGILPLCQILNDYTYTPCPTAIDQPNFAIIFLLMFDLNCDDGDKCTHTDMIRCDCTCKGIYIDSDEDGVCDDKDVCHGFPDIFEQVGEDPVEQGPELPALFIPDANGQLIEVERDVNNNDIPDGCDFALFPNEEMISCQGGNKIGTPCSEPEPRFIKKADGGGFVEVTQVLGIGVWTYDQKKLKCICQGVPCDDGDYDGVCDEVDVCQGYPDVKHVVGADGAITGEDMVIWVPSYAADGKTLLSVNTTTGPLIDIDLDNDGISNHCDACPNQVGDIGTPCDDGEPCTVNDRMTKGATANAPCLCAGELLDTDLDGVYNGLDQCEGYDDVNYPDFDGDGIPDACDPPWYALGCPDAMLMANDDIARGLKLYFNTTEALSYLQLPKPIHVKVQYGNKMYEEDLVDLLAFGPLMNANNQLEKYELYYEMPDMPTAAIAAETNVIYYINYSDQQTCMFGGVNTTGGGMRPVEDGPAPIDVSSLLNVGCPTSFIVDADKHVNFVYNSPGPINPQNFVTSVTADHVEMKLGYSLNGSYDVTSTVAPAASGSGYTYTMVLSTQYTTGSTTTFPAVNGTFTFNNGLTCTYTAGAIQTLPCSLTATPPCLDCDDLPLPSCDFYLGQPCSDCNPLTINDAYNGSCQCVGTLGMDTDGDGVHDAEDKCPGNNDLEDFNPENGVPDGCECVVPIVESMTLKDVNNVEIIVTPNPAHVSYSVSYFSSNNVQEIINAGSFEALPIVLKRLTTGRIYNITVSATCASGFTSKAEAQEITVPYDANAYSCGVLPTNAPANCLGATFLSTLMADDIVKAGDFNVTIASVSGSGGTFSGSGYIEVPLFNDARVNVTFTDISVTEQYVMCAGQMKVTGAGVALISEDLAAQITAITGTLGQINDALAQVQQILENIETVVDQMNTVSDFQANSGTLNGFNSVLNQLPYLPTGVATAYTNALNCMSQASTQAEFDICKPQLATAVENLNQAIAALYAGDFQVLFEKHDQQLWGFDAMQHEAMKAEYWALPIAGQTYYVPWKAVKSGQNDKVKVRRSDDQDMPSSIHFDQEGTPSPQVIPPATGHRTELPVTSTGNLNINEHFAVYPDAANTTLNHIAGRLNVVSYDEKALNIVIVPVQASNSSWTPPAFDANVYQDLISNIFKPAVVNVTVSVGSTLTVSDFDGTLAEISTGLLSSYTADMKAIINAYTPNNPLVDGTYYIFIVEGADPNTLQGYMPKNKGFGFVVYGNHGSSPAPEVLARTIAHEIGHGAFVLEHVFETYPSLPVGSSDNLMDYGTGTSLIKPQWDRIHSDISHHGLFDSDDEAEDAASIVLPCKVPPSGGYFLTLANVAIWLEGNTTFDFHRVPYYPYLATFITKEKRNGVDAKIRYGIDYLLHINDLPGNFPWEFQGFRSGNTTYMSDVAKVKPLGSPFILFEPLFRIAADNKCYCSIGKIPSAGYEYATEDGKRMAESNQQIELAHASQDQDCCNGILYYQDVPDENFAFHNPVNDNYCNLPTAPGQPPTPASPVQQKLNTLLEGSEKYNITVSELMAQIHEDNAYNNDIQGNAYKGNLYIYKDNKLTRYGKMDDGTFATEVIEGETAISNRLDLLKARNFPGGVNAPDIVQLYEYKDGKLRLKVLGSESALTAPTAINPNGYDAKYFENEINNAIKDKITNRPGGGVTGDFTSAQTIQGEGNDGNLIIKQGGLVRWVTFAGHEIGYIVKNAEVNQDLWNPVDLDNINPNSRYYAKLITMPAPAGGIADQTLVEISDVYELVYLVEDVVKDPEESIGKLYNGIKNMNWGPETIAKLAFGDILEGAEAIDAAPVNSKLKQYHITRQSIRVVTTVLNAQKNAAKKILRMQDGGGVAKNAKDFKLRLQGTFAHFNKSIPADADFLEKFSKFGNDPNLPNDYSVGQSLREDFVDDFGDNVDDVLAAKFKNTPEMLDAYKLLSELGRDKLRKNPQLLEKMGKLLKSNNLGLDAEKMKTMFKHHGTYGRGSKVENDIYLDIDGNEIEGVENIISHATLDADELLDALKQLDAAPPSGVASMIGDLTSATQPKKFIGAEFQLRYYKNNSPNGVSGFEVQNNVAGVDRRIDIVPNPPPDIKRIELKSWRSFSTTYWPGATNEFVKDLRQIDQLSDMKWSFDAKGSFTKNADGNAYLKQNFMAMLGSDQGRAKLQELLNVDGVNKLQALFPDTPNLNTVDKFLTEFSKNGVFDAHIKIE